MSLLVQIPSPAIQIVEVIFLTLVTGIGLQTQIFYCYALKGCQQKKDLQNAYGGNTELYIFLV